MLNESNESRGSSTRDERSAAAATPSRIPSGSRIVQSRRVVPVARAGGSILVDADREWRVGLDAFATRAWELLADQPTLPELVERLRDDGVRCEQLAEDVTHLLERLREKGVITWR